MRDGRKLENLEASYPPLLYKIIKRSLSDFTSSAVWRRRDVYLLLLHVNMAICLGLQMGFAIQLKHEHKARDLELRAFISTKVWLTHVYK